MKIPFSKPYITRKEIAYIKDSVLNGGTIAGDGPYTRKVHDFFEKRYGVKKALLTTSATTALELAIKLLSLKTGDEVLVPSFTFSSTVNAILADKGVKPVFVDVEDKTLNIDLYDLERKITKRSKAIMVVHYAGTSCDMDYLIKIAKKHGLKIIEDAAQSIEAKYKNRYLGTIGDMGVLSFHATKNITCGEGGVLFINKRDKKLIENAEIIREKGTNRTKFLRGEVDKYTWVNFGSSILPSDILAAFLLAQLENIDNNIGRRLKIFHSFTEAFKKYENSGVIKLPDMPDYSTHNGHIFFMLFNNQKTRNEAMDYLKSQGIGATFHYIPLHSSPYGKALGNKPESCPVTDSVSQCLLRLPIHSNLTQKEVNYIIFHLSAFLDSVIARKPVKKLYVKEEGVYANS